MRESSERAPRPPGPKPRYTREQVLGVALALLQRRGRDGLSLRGLADELGLTAMAIYRYFASKDDLLDAIVAAALADVAPKGPPDGAWGTELETAIRQLHRALARSRAIAELVALRRPGAQLDPLRADLLAITGRMGLDDRAADETLRALTSYAFGFTLVEPASDGRPRHATSAAAFEHGLQLLMDGIRARHLR